jgi:hypothetical protein
MNANQLRIRPSAVDPDVGVFLAAAGEATEALRNTAIATNRGADSLAASSKRRASQ